MRNLEYQNVVYDNRIYGIEPGLRNRIRQSTMECLKRKRSGTRRKISKTEIIIKLSLIISIISLITVLWIG